MENDLETIVKKYNYIYNTSFKLSDLYSLFPESDEEYGFNNSWPNVEEAGVYVVFNSRKEIIYVGEAISFGRRLSKHFPLKQGKCVPNEEEFWCKDAMYIKTIPAPSNAKWERLSLEGYLICVCKPCGNIRK